MKPLNQVEKIGPEFAEKYVQYLIHEGSKAPLKFKTFGPPSWYDVEKFQRGQQFIRENYFVVSLSTLFTPFTFLLEPKFVNSFIEVGKYDTFKNTSYHFIQIFHNIRTWYSGNIYDKNSTAYEKFYSAINVHLKYSSNYVVDETGFSQKDLAATIYAHVALVVSEYDQFYDEKKFEGFIHFWRVISYHFGQTDEFNLCDGNVAEVIKKCEKVSQTIFVPVLDELLQTDRIILIHALDLIRCGFWLIENDGLLEFVRRRLKLPAKPVKNIKSKIFVPTISFVYDKILKTWWISPVVLPILNYLTRIYEDYSPIYLPVTSKLLGIKT